MHNFHQHIHDHHDGSSPLRGRRGAAQRGRGGPGGGFGGGGFAGGPRFGGHRARRGDIRPVLLVGLLDGPAHGYELIRRLEERSGGSWRPSPGSVYPTLQLLEEEGLLSAEEREGKRTYTLTDTGRQAAEEAALEGRPPWERPDAGPGGARHLRGAVEQVALAARQVAMAGQPEQVERAVAILTDARQQLYRLLAEA